MVRCSNTDCAIGVWYHIDCVGLRKLPTENEVWYCSVDCQRAPRKSSQDYSVQQSDDDDHVRNYSIAVVWNGLLDLIHRDAIREADGNAMMTMWRCNMVRFWSGHHFKYLKIGHRLLSGKIS